MIPSTDKANNENVKSSNYACQGCTSQEVKVNINTFYGPAVLTSKFVSFNLVLAKMPQATTVLEIIFPHSQDICPFKSSFWSDILQIGPDIIY